MKELLEVAKLLATFAFQLLIFVPVFLTIAVLKLVDREDAATEVEDWWLHL